MKTTKTCTKCGDRKPLSEFYKGDRYSGGYTTRCKDCARAYARRYDRTVRRPKRVGEKLMYKFGITLADYNAMFEAQGSGCAICGRTPAEEGRRLAVDHDHRTGKVRGLLCWSCNTAIGRLQDNPDLCHQAALYLQRA